MYGIKSRIWKTVIYFINSLNNIPVATITNHKDAFQNYIFDMSMLFEK